MGERTEQPTARHLAEMRKRGDIAMSPELTGAISLIVAVYLLASRLPGFVSSLQGIMRNSFTNLAVTGWTVQDVSARGMQLTWQVVREWLPLFLAIVGVGIGVGVLQTRGRISPDRIKPNFKHVNPVNGIKRTFSKQGFFETAKGVIKVALLGIVLYTSVKEVPTQLALLTNGADIRSGINYVGTVLDKVARQGAMLLVLAAGIDYAFQFQQHRKRTLMTREEVQEEMKSAEGQPMMRAKIRQMMRRMSRQRMMQQIEHSDVVVTNPTHLAIALRYESKTMAAPVVVAKGKGFIAAEIVRRAKEHHVPIVQNIPLAHALIHIELDNPVPVALYAAVAEVLAFVYRLRGKNGRVN
jgi:flagellar biosynthesis protein FlhB